MCDGVCVVALDADVIGIENIACAFTNEADAELVVELLQDEYGRGGRGRRTSRCPRRWTTRTCSTTWPRAGSRKRGCGSH
jgi:hypothetical protein